MTATHHEVYRLLRRVDRDDCSREAIARLYDPIARSHHAFARSADRSCRRGGAEALNERVTPVSSASSDATRRCVASDGESLRLISTHDCSNDRSSITTTRSPHPHAAPYRLVGRRDTLSMRSVACCDRSNSALSVILLRRQLVASRETSIAWRAKLIVPRRAPARLRVELIVLWSERNSVPAGGDLTARLRECHRAITRCPRPSHTVTEPSTVAMPMTRIATAP
jgi:hypothetical protein